MSYAHRSEEVSMARDGFVEAASRDEAGEGTEDLPVRYELKEEECGPGIGRTMAAFAAVALVAFMSLPGLTNCWEVDMGGGLRVPLCTAGFAYFRSCISGTSYV